MTAVATMGVWYVSYGSNLDPDRLRTYLAGGRPDGGHHTYAGARNTDPPTERRPCLIPHKLYFAGESRTWGGGIAFLDHELVEPAPTFGHAYRLTIDQFEDVAAQETGRPTAPIDIDHVCAAGSVTLGNGRYDRIVWLGDVEGIPQLTFTSPAPASVTPTAPPRARYLRRIMVGLRTVHGLTANQIADYLLARDGIGDHWPHEDLISLAQSS